MRRFIVLTLLLLCVPATAHASAPVPFTPLERGDRGHAVKLVQRALTTLGYRTRVDGVFGPRTLRLVRRYERRQRLAVDGAVSRGQARGMLRRARMDVRRIDRAARSAARPRAVVVPAFAGPAVFPIRGPWTQGDTFGTRGGRHQGTDLLAACGTPLVSAVAGRVVITGRHGAAGNYVVVRDVVTSADHVYMHLAGTPAVSKGDVVAAGTQLGLVGRTGNASACHLHFEIWTAPGWYEGGRPRDPAPDLRAWTGS